LNVKPRQFGVVIAQPAIAQEASVDRRTNLHTRAWTVPRIQHQQPHI